MAILSQGLVLLVAGMGIVFAFLGVLVFIMSLSAKVIPRFNHILPDHEPKRKSAKTTAGTDDTEIAIAIAVAAAQSI
jgi:oxaloacetate decarboxylase (Na+ extruding) subunit gamma